MYRFWLFLLVLLMTSQLSACAQESATNESIPQGADWELFSQIDVIRRQSYCPTEDYQRAKENLIDIYEADVADRKSFNENVSARDLDRRERVAKIAAKGCLFDQDDYWIAALVYQHGQLPQHYLQAIMYANKAADIKNGGQGSSDKRFDNVDGLQQVTIDRYLMSRGHKQLFGTQITSPAFYKKFESEVDGKPCVWPLDKSFDVKRDYTAGTDAYRLMLDTQISAKITQFGECDFPARDSKQFLPNLLIIPF